MLPTSLPDALMRHFIGLDHHNRLSQEAQQASNYPPFNIEQIGSDRYVLTLAVAGFTQNEIEITLLNGQLTVKGEKDLKNGPDDENSVFLHRGLSLRDFARTFTLAEHIQIKSAEIHDGLLRVKLERIVPESAKPRIIPIRTMPPVSRIPQANPKPVADEEAATHAPNDAMGAGEKQWFISPSRD